MGSTPTIESRRLITFDLMKGYAVIGLLFLHGLIHGTWHSADTALSILPVWLLVILAPLIIAATWGGGFALLSGFVNMFNALNKMSKGYKRKDALVPIILNSIIIILLDPVRCYFLVVPWKRLFSGNTGYSLINNLIVNSKLEFPPFEQIISPGALPMIGIAGLLCALFISIYFDKDGKSRGHSHLHIILLSIGLLVFLFGEPISHAMYTLEKDMFFRGGILRILAYPLVMIGGDILSFLPSGGYAFLGMSFALIYLQDDSKSKIKKYSRIISAVSGLIFLIFISIMVQQSGDVSTVISKLFDYRVPTRALTFFNATIITIILSALLRHYEYDTADIYKAKARKTVWVRRWGMMTLTLYMLDPIFNSAFSQLFHMWFGDPSLKVDAFMTNVPAIFLFAATIICFWFSLIWAWEKIAFKGSLESLIVWFGGLFRKNKSQRLNVKKNLYLE